MHSQELLTSFTNRAEAMGAQVIPVAGPGEVGPKLAEILRPLGGKIALVDSPLVKTAGVEKALSQAGFSIEKDGAEFARQADTGIVEFDYGIAETGTLAMDATDLKTRLAAMLPLTCVALLPVEQLRASLTEVIDAYLARGTWPGYFTLVTGPSRTADIERSLTIGVHGPERLLIILVGNNGGDRHGR
ncbi:5-formyltetrahydrofolate cyclo-ligase-like domain [Moorella glycerini]|uniref:Lactate utilization protein C n=1 Tax=Neomoorella stamsii TaxID=1266720 RepID=A0A9X7P4Z2_9FIRM|nr:MULTISPECIES: lactate utilization protein [Moorella]PRR69941.1 Lactate utilization protein C [Moorella stamsii]CEP68508.1 5-formyltetrahydrofolate cyclo-ligase-like domain [Moorella glycerini]